MSRNRREFGRFGKLKSLGLVVDGIRGVPGRESAHVVLEYSDGTTDILEPGEARHLALLLGRGADTVDLIRNGRTEWVPLGEEDGAEIGTLKAPATLKKGWIPATPAARARRG
jgi:hypothetical protein